MFTSSRSLFKTDVFPSLNLAKLFFSFYNLSLNILVKNYGGMINFISYSSSFTNLPFRMSENLIINLSIHKSFIHSLIMSFSKFFSLFIHSFVYSSIHSKTIYQTIQSPIKAIDNLPR